MSNEDRKNKDETKTFIVKVSMPILYDTVIEVEAFDEDDVAEVVFDMLDADPNSFDWIPVQEVYDEAEIVSIHEKKA